MHRTEINMTQYFVRRKDAETKIGSWCDWNHIILNGKFVLFTDLPEKLINEIVDEINEMKK